MARFLDKRTGQVVEVFKRPQIVNRRQRRDRYEEITDELPTTSSGPYPSTATTVNVDDVPDGTVTEVLEWAGDDPDRQAAAVEAERQGKRRKGILQAFT